MIEYTFDDGEFSMPDDIFYPVGTNVCVMVWEAHTPHDTKQETFFGYCKDDGFVKKISEKDAKTLLSNETLLDQHVTEDEYAEAVQYLVSGIGRVVEYHRSKNAGDALQGIKIFGEGSAIAGIEKILERELGAPVQHFETLSGVQIKGQAALTAEEVLRYLPNIGAVIQPMQLKLDFGRKEI